MSIFKSYLTFFIKKIVIFALSIFYGSLVVLKLIYARLRHGKEYFDIKERPLPPACLQDPAFKHSYIKLKGIKIHVAECGNRSNPLMLFVHGFPEFWFSWKNQMNFFSNKYWTVSIDMRGYGDSEKPSSKSKYQIDYLIQDIKDIVKMLGKESCILVGHDWGGVVCWYSAATTSTTECIDKLIILNAPHPATYTAKVRSSWKQFLKSWYIFYFQLPYLPEYTSVLDDLSIFNKMFRKSDGTDQTDEFYEAFKYTFSKPENWTAPLNYYRASLLREDSELLKLQKIKQPTLIVWGEADLALEPDFPELAQEFCTGPFKIKKIKNGNHFIQNDRPEEVNMAIEDFLA